MDCYILRTVLLVVILPFIIAIICYHYAKQIKTKKYWPTNNINLENNELKKVSIKNQMLCFDDIIKFKDFLMT